MGNTVNNAVNATANAESANVANVANVITTDVIVKEVSLYVARNESETSMVTMKIDKMLPNFVFDSDTDERVEEEVAQIAIPRSALVAELSDIDDDFALFRASLGRKMPDQKQLGILLFKAKMTITHELVVEGQTYPSKDGEKTAENDFYLTTVKKIIFTPKAIAKMDDATTL